MEPGVFRWTEEAKNGKRTLHESSDPADSYLDGLILRHDRPCYVDSSTEGICPITLTEEDKENIKNTLQENKVPVVEITSPHPSIAPVGTPRIAPVLDLSTTDLSATVFETDTPEWTERVLKSFTEQLGGTIPLCCELVDEATMLIAFMLQNMKKLATLDTSSQFHRTMMRAMTSFGRSYGTIKTGVESLKILNSELLDYNAAYNDLDAAFLMLGNEKDKNLKNHIGESEALKLINDLVIELQHMEAEFFRIDFKNGLRNLQEEIIKEADNMFLSPLPPSNTTWSSSSHFGQ